MPTIYDVHAKPDELGADGMGTHYLLTELIPRPTNGDEGPYMLRAQLLTPNGIIASHFHRRGQWQVVVEGHGWLGKQPFSSIALHYTDA